jgi:NDP-sugar pyrophosphorylase family protein
VKQLNEAVILVGGKGTRLQSVVTDRPKVLAPVCGKPFLAYLLDQIASAGIHHTILCVGYRGDQVKATFGQTYAGMSLTYSQETSLFGTGGALRLAWPQIASKTIIAMNGDSFCDVNFLDLEEWHIIHHARATIAMVQRPNVARYGCVSLSENGAISSFEEKGKSLGPGWVNAGIYVLDADLISVIPPDQSISLEHEVFPRWIGQQFYGYHCRGRFLDIGTPESYNQAEKFFSNTEIGSSLG